MLEQRPKKRLQKSLTLCATLELQVYIFQPMPLILTVPQMRSLNSTLLKLFLRQIQEKTQQLQNTFKLNMTTQLEDEKEEKLVKKNNKKKKS